MSTLSVPVYYCPTPKKQPEPDTKAVKLEWRVNETESSYEICPPPKAASAIAQVKKDGNKFRLIAPAFGINSVAPTIEACVLCLAIKSYGHGWTSG
jgi:hypothetical protein